jgi:hypothetical protein
MGRVPPKALPKVKHDIMGSRKSDARIGAGDPPRRETRDGKLRPAHQTK